MTWKTIRNYKKCYPMYITLGIDADTVICQDLILARQTVHLGN